MNTTFLKQLWLAIRIWLLAVAVNTLLGTLYLSELWQHSVADFLLIGAWLGALYTLPVMVVLLIIINRCAAAEKSGLFLFRFVFLSGIVLTVVVFMFFFWPMWGGNWRSLDSKMLLSIAILSGIIGIASFYKSLFKWGRDLNSI